MQNPRSDHRKDLVQVAETLNLIVHYELGNFVLLHHLLPAAAKGKPKGSTVAQTVKAIRYVTNNPHKVEEGLWELKEQLDKRLKENVTKRAGLEEVWLWVTAKLEKRALKEVLVESTEV